MNRAVEGADPSQQSSLSEFDGRLSPLVTFRTPHITFPADKGSSRHKYSRLSSTSRLAT